MKLSIVAFEIQEVGTREEQAEDCIRQLNEFISKGGCGISNIIALNFFLSATDVTAFEDQKKLLADCLPDTIKNVIPVAYLAQAPANGAMVSAEMHYLPDIEGVTITSKNMAGINYLAIEGKGGDKWVVANGICTGKKKHQIAEDSDWVFGVMETILQSEGLDFSNIFRQWNYIEGITTVELKENAENQHYQLFNNVRSKYYATSEFVNGYPAATGIGTMAGGVVISFYATTQSGPNVISVENPLQKAAFEYSEEVLVGEAAYKGFCKCTPKFARAKLVSNTQSVQVYISGTASIREEKTIAEDDVTEQTRITIENVEKLISEQTLSNIDGMPAEQMQIDFFRVYIKNPSDYRMVKHTCESRWPGISGIYVVSDVCRDNLLVEIEALASVRQ
ncbi:MAG: hypothetical protein V2B15_13285 [Bacteroidota bacterium]